MLLFYGWLVLDEKKSEICHLCVYAAFIYLILVSFLLRCLSSALMSLGLFKDFYQNVMTKADVIQPTGDAITIFTEAQCLTPRFVSDVQLTLFFYIILF